MFERFAVGALLDNLLREHNQAVRSGLAIGFQISAAQADRINQRRKLDGVKIAPAILRLPAQGGDGSFEFAEVGNDRHPAIIGSRDSRERLLSMRAQYDRR